MKLQLDSIECEIRQGTMADAQWYSYSANKSNGMRRTTDDKVRAVKSALRHCKGQQGDREISRHVGVDGHTVAKYRRELLELGEIAPKGEGPSAEIPQMREGELATGQPARVVTRKGKTYQMKVGSIGKAKKANRKKFGGIAKDAAVPTRKPGKMIPTLTISIALNNPQVAAGALLSNCEEGYLRAMIAEILSVLDGGKRK